MFSLPLEPSSLSAPSSWPHSSTAPSIGSSASVDPRFRHSGRCREHGSSQQPRKHRQPSQYQLLTPIMDELYIGGRDPDTLNEVNDRVNGLLE